VLPAARSSLLQHTQSWSTAGMSWEDDDWDADDMDDKLKLDMDDKKKDEEVWSDEEGHDMTKSVEETKKPIPVPTPAPPKPKTGLELKIEQREKREKEEAERKAAAAKAVEAELNLEGMDAATADKVRRQKLEEQADLDAAIDSFGPGGASKPPPGRQPAPGSLDEFAPKTDADFEKLADMMNQKLMPHQDTKGHMVALKALLRAACSNMSTDDCKDLSSFVAVLSNDKIKADREKDKKGKSKGKAKGKINIAASKAADNDMDDIGRGGGGGGRVFHDDNDDFEW